MIDFRYHLVSLMAVLVALTIGVILGAGPLQGPLSESLTGQVDKLTERQASLTEQNEQLKAHINDDQEMLKAIAPRAVSGSLTDVEVALVRTHDATDEAADRVGAYLDLAGGTIGTEISLSPAWFDDAAAQTRQAVAKRLVGYLGDAVDADATDDDILVQGLVMAMASDDENTQVIRDLLTSSEFDLVSGTFGSPVQGIVVVSATNGDLGKPTGADKSPAAITSLGRILGRYSSVIIGDALDNDDFITRIRHDEIDVTTIDSVGSERAGVSAPLALNATRASHTAAYGIGIGASKAAPEAGDLS